MAHRTLHVTLPLRRPGAPLDRNALEVGWQKTVTYSKSPVKQMGEHLGVAPGGENVAERTIDAGTEMVLLEVSDGIGVITLNRPERRNALHRDMYPAIRAGLADFADADDVTCVVLTGAGEGFCAGGDVRDGRRRGSDEPAPTIEEASAALLDDAQVARLLHESPKLTIAAVNGAAVGAGLSLALACDLRVIAPGARLIPGWGKLAFSGDFGGTWFLTRLLGPARALEMLIANTTVTGADAVAVGLANHVTAGDSFEAEWRAWVAPFAAGPRAAITLMKENVRQALTDPLGPALVDESRRMVLSGQTADHREAVRAWLDKREPDFRSSRG
jgi:2-(1,2-epoxy-1,2-dihydrophenyl)acetyl-CoA isomerase